MNRMNLSGLVCVFLVTFMLAGTLAAPTARAAIFGVKTMDPSNAPATLFSLDDNGENPSVIGTVKLNNHEIDVDALAQDAAGTLYGFQVADGAWSRLITIDTATAEASVVGVTLFSSNLRGAMFTNDGRLFVLDADNNGLFQVDPATGQTQGWGVPVTVGGQAFDLNNADLAQRMDGSTVLVDGSNAGSRFYTMDLDTGEMVHLHSDWAKGPEGVPVDIAGIALSPYGDNPERLVAYDIKYKDDIFHYDPTNSWARTTALLNIIPQYSAGRGDLAGPVVPEPATLGLLGLGGLALLRRRRKRAESAPARRASKGASRMVVLLIAGSLALAMMAASAQAETIVYDSTPFETITWQSQGQGARFDRGSEVILAGTDRTLVRAEIAVTLQDRPGTIDVIARIFANDAPDSKPGTLLWESGWIEDVPIVGWSELVSFDIPNVTVPDHITVMIGEKGCTTGALYGEPLSSSSAVGASVYTWGRNWDTGQWQLMQWSTPVSMRITAVPEPATLGLLGLGGLAILRRRKR